MAEDEEDGSKVSCLLVVIAANNIINLPHHFVFFVLFLFDIDFLCVVDVRATAFRVKLKSEVTGKKKKKRKYARSLFNFS